MSIPKRNNLPWKSDDLRKMRTLARQGLSAHLAAPQLQRSVGALKYKAMVEGVSFHFITQPKGVQKRLHRRKRSGRRS